MGKKGGPIGKRFSNDALTIFILLLNLNNILRKLLDKKRR
jgi:hypothetical protein